MTTKPKKTAKPKPKAAAKPKTAAKPRAPKAANDNSVEPRVKHAPEMSRPAQRQAAGWRDGQPTGYVDGE
ncbi:hypothetical protein [Parvibaculum sp.]|uniref:hypothetical protein n=1 Tax=Parvibaculum sp. TaxID=2024848 RepID=UPI0026298DDB|nr:hypothetical protein [Parvibaculum sp.]MCW5728144.1 hypothetical protein [Parvibaculum sp.]